MQRKAILGTTLLIIFALTVTMKPASAVDTLTPADFKLQSFSKALDFFDFARAYAASAGKPVPPANWHAYLYQTYINKSGFQLYYSGLINITGDDENALTIPVQSFIEHYKTPKGKDVLTSSSFIMLLAFNETPASRYPNSPDINDKLYASFTLGFDISNVTGSAHNPSLNSRTEIIPLTSSADNLTWNWGMRYTNLTAIWWLMDIDPITPGYQSFPVAITTYDELTFKYRLTINPTDNTAKVTASYIIGRMTNLWIVHEWKWWLIVPIPIFARLNSTGTYYAHNGTRISNQTIYQFLEEQHIKMSIVLFQNSLILGHKTSSVNDADGKNVTDAEEDVTSGSISTKADDNEKIFEADFGTKREYTLYNYTSGQTQGPYDAVTRTVPRLGFAKNPLFFMHVALLKYVPLIVKNIDPQLFQQAKEHMLNMTYADYFYVISYPTYSGYQITHDPTYTAYIAVASAGTPPNPIGLILIGVIVVAGVAGAIYALRRRSSKTQRIQPSQTTIRT